MTRAPDGWQSAPLGEVCGIFSGSTPKTGVPEFWGGDIKWITPNDLSKDRSQVVYGGERNLTAAGYESCSVRIFPAGAVIVSSRAPIGYVAIAGSDMCTNQGCKSALPPDFVDARYLYWFLVNARPDLEARASGTTFREISGKRFAETKFWWPRIEEQRRIVEILEDLLSRLDAADTDLASALQRLASLREGMVRAELTGGRGGQSRGRAQLQGVGVDDGSLPEMPPGWHWKRLQELADVMGGVTKDAKRESDPTLVAVPYLRVANVQRGRLDLSTVTSIRVPQATVDKLSLWPGDVLLNEGGDRDKLGRGWVWEGQVEICIHQNHVFRARVRDSQLDPYLLSWAANSFGGSWCERNGRQSVNLASISLSKIKMMPIPVPPRDEQPTVAARIRTVLDASTRLEREVVGTRQRRTVLHRSLLAAAFSGRLTGRPTDVELVEELSGV
jgi:type I restriction enzyme, S subunit